MEMYSLHEGGMGFIREASPLLNSPLAPFFLNEGKMVSFEFSSPLLATAFKPLHFANQGSFGYALA